MIRGIDNILNELNLPSTSSILDIGCYGLQGSNTSKALTDKFYEFGTIEGICFNNYIPEKFNRIKLYEGDYFSIYPNKTYDLVCCDLGAISQIKLIENDLDNKLYNLLNTNGILIFYIFRTNNYSPYENEIKDHILSYWVKSVTELSDLNGLYALSKNNISAAVDLKFSNTYELLNVYEELRNYILWVVLKKK